MSLYNFLVLLVHSTAVIGLIETQYAIFNFTSDPRYGSAPLGDPWVEATLTSCVVTCMRVYPNCYSVVFNDFTNKCTPGDKITYNAPRPSNVIGDKFYYRDYCNSTLGYRLHVYNSVVQCFYFTTTWGIYSTARSVCAAKGGRVMQAKTRDQLDLFLSFCKDIYKTYTFLGLTDIDTEGTFVWEDGEVIDPAWKKIIFMSGEPNGETAEVDCSVCASFSSSTVCTTDSVTGHPQRVTTTSANSSLK